MENCKIKNIEIYQPMYQLIEELYEKYNLMTFSYISIGTDNEMFHFDDTKNQNFYFCIDFSLNKIEDFRITFTYGTENPIKNNKHYFTLFDEYIDSLEQVSELCKNIKAFISNKLKIMEYYIGNKKIGTDLHFYYIDKNKIVLSKGYFSPFFVLPWNRKKIKTIIYEFEPWIESMYSIK